MDKVFKFIFRSLFFAILASLAVFLFPTSVLASTFQVSGSIKDSVGTGIADSTINLVNSSNGIIVATTASDSSGNYAVTVDGGTYNINAIPPGSSGFGSATAPNYAISANTTINFILVSAGSVSFSGHLFDSFGVPLSGQRVELLDSTNTLITRSTTDSNGFYSLTASTGNYKIHLEIDNTNLSFNTLQYGEFKSSLFSLTQSQVVDFTIPAKDITVHVQDSAGNPISGALVQAYGSPAISFNGFNFSSSQQWGYVGTPPLTDSTGNVHIRLYPGTVSVTTNPPTGSVYLPATSNFTISNNATQQILVTLQTPVVFSGHLYNSLGSPLPNQSVYLLNSVNTVIGQTITNSSGVYALTVSPGNYKIKIEIYDPGRTFSTLQYGSFISSIFALSQSQTVDFTIPAKDITVKVQDVFGNPISGALVQAYGFSSISFNGFNFSSSQQWGYVGTPPLTDSSGNVHVWLYPGTATITVTPPTGSGFLSTSSNSIITSDNSQQITKILQKPVVFSGHLYNSFGTPLPDQPVYLLDSTNTLVAQTTTNYSGAYSFNVSIGNYKFKFEVVNQNLSLNTLQYADFISGVFTLTQNQIADFTLPAKKVSVHVQDQSGSPISNVSIQAIEQSPVSFGGFDFTTAMVQWGYVGTPPPTDSSGNTYLWLYPGLSRLTVNPTLGGPYASFSTDITISGDQNEIFSLQFVHSQPVTTLSISPSPNNQGQYSNPVTATLQATAASGFTIAHTYFTVDEGSQQSYTTPFIVSGEGNHTITYWSVDNVGVYESVNSDSFTVFSNQSPVISGLSDISISEGSDYSTNGTFSDPTSTSWAGTVDYGDGFGNQSLTISGTNFSLNHIYEDNGIYIVTVSITDNQGATETAAATITVNNVAPTITSFAVDSNLVQLNALASVAGTFTDPGILDTHLGGIDWGDGNVSSPLIDETNGSGSLTGSHTYTTGGVYTIVLTLIDKDGEMTSSQTQITVNNPPTANAGGPYSVDEGGSANLLGSGTDTDNDQLTYAWDLDHNGTFETSGQNVNFSAANLDGPSTKTVALQVCDNKGACATSDATLNILNVDPTATFSNNGPINEGFSVLASFSGQLDPSTADVNAGFHYAYSCDGSPITANYSTGGLLNTHNCTFTDNGSYTVLGRIIDKDDGYIDYLTTVTVDNVNPNVGNITVSPTGPQTINSTINVGANFTDPGTLDTHIATWNWGDGNTTNGIVTEANGSGSVTGTHTYTASGVYTITLVVTDNNNASGQSSTMITVINQVTSLSPAQVWIGLKNSDDVGIKFDLLVEAYVNGNLISSGKLNSVTGGGNGFNNANLQSISFESFSPVDFPTGSTLGIKVYARNACTGSGHNSGTARLWYNDSQANSQFGSTIGTSSYSDYLLNNFVLGTTIGSGPKKTIDVSAGAKCSVFKSFGTWTITP